MGKTYSFAPLNDFAALASLLIKFGGSVPKFREEGSVWFLARVGDNPTVGTFERGDTIEVTDSYVRVLATLARELHLNLFEHADSHRPYPPLLRDDA